MERPIEGELILKCNNSRQGVFQECTCSRLLYSAFCRLQLRTATTNQLRNEVAHLQIKNSPSIWSKFLLIIKVVVMMVWRVPICAFTWMGKQKIGLCLQFLLESYDTLQHSICTKGPEGNDLGGL